MVIVSAVMLRSRLFRPWLGWFDFGASAVYALAQLELLATVIPGLRYWELAGLLGSLLELAWIGIMGVFLLRAHPEPVQQTATAGPVVMRPLSA